MNHVRILMDLNHNEYAVATDSTYSVTLVREADWCFAMTHDGTDSQRFANPWISNCTTTRLETSGYLHLLSFDFYNSKLVLRKAFQFASLASLVGLSLLYPLIETLDHWDAPGPSSDSEITIIVLLTFVGIVFVLRHLLTSLIISVLTGLLPHLYSHRGTPINVRFSTFYPRVTASPPLSLRI